jgi:hypothetical protein
MSDTEQNMPNKTGASGAAWSDIEKVSSCHGTLKSKAYCRTDCLLDRALRERGQSRRQNCCKLPHFYFDQYPLTCRRQRAPVPAGRSIVSCKKLLVRLKEKYKDDIEKIKASQALTAASASANGEAVAMPEKVKTPGKRKAKIDAESYGKADVEGSPKKKAGGRKKKGEATPIKEEVNEEATERITEDDIRSEGGFGV